MNVYTSNRKRNHGLVKRPEEGFQNEEEEAAAYKKAGCQWEPFEMSFKDLARNDYDRVLKFSLYKVPKRGNKTFLGEA